MKHSTSDGADLGSGNDVVVLVNYGILRKTLKARDDIGIRNFEQGPVRPCSPCLNARKHDDMRITLGPTSESLAFATSHNHGYGT